METRTTQLARPLLVSQNIDMFACHSTFAPNHHGEPTFLATAQQHPGLHDEVVKPRPFGIGRKELFVRSKRIKCVGQ